MDTLRKFREGWRVLQCHHAGGAIVRVDETVLKLHHLAAAFSALDTHKAFVVLRLVGDLHGADLQYRPALRIVLRAQWMGRVAKRAIQNGVTLFIAGDDRLAYPFSHGYFVIRFFTHGKLPCFALYDKNRPRHYLRGLEFILVGSQCVYHSCLSYKNDTEVGHCLLNVLPP
jgi:hypothetical protein